MVQEGESAGGQMISKMGRQSVRYAGQLPQKKIGMMRIATMFTTLIMGLIAGPLVSL